jgi:protein-S-isoprenylcysteine O-methyltransferase Ste14
MARFWLSERLTARFDTPGVVAAAPRLYGIAFPATALVVDEPFRFTRNPLYLARTILYVGLAAAMNSPGRS